MFLGQNRFLGQPGGENFTANPDFLNQGSRPMPAGLQRFLNKKGINSPEDLNNRLQYAPRMPFRK